MLDNMPRALGHTADTAAGTAIVASAFGYLPSLAALAGFLWYAIQVYESKTVQGWIAKLSRKPPEA